ncbi:hypothetical protein RMQ97_03825 [Maricaulis sp. D1M11]|uniref:hypothetical protein n=1 Tax=Maricaulis sp. D1M11 TaxID=3076117 RepID=UPI0039B536AD
MHHSDELSPNQQLYADFASSGTLGLDDEAGQIVVVANVSTALLADLPDLIDEARAELNEMAWLP